jgi:hypothetical protein
MEHDICMNDKLYMLMKGLNTPIRLACTINPRKGVKFSDLDSLFTYVVQYESDLKYILYILLCGKVWKQL